MLQMVYNKWLELFVFFSSKKRLNSKLDKILFQSDQACFFPEAIHTFSRLH